MPSEARARPRHSTSFNTSASSVAEVIGLEHFYEGVEVDSKESQGVEEGRGREWRAKAKERA
jgi:hypothetical protein